MSNWTGSAWARVLHEKFVYDDWNLVSVFNGTNNALIRSFVWGTDLSGTMRDAGGVGGLLVVNDQTAGVSFPGYDANGNVALLASAGSGSVSGTYEYSAFGEAIRLTGGVAEANPFRFSTRFTDEESGLSYYGYRYSSPSRGIWISRDPIDEIGWRKQFVQRRSAGIPQEPNSYAVVMNDPLGNIDWLGLKTMQECYDDHSAQNAAGLKVFQKELSGCGMSLGLGTVICIVGCATANVFPVVGQGFFVMCAGWCGAADVCLSGACVINAMNNHRMRKRSLDASLCACIRAAKDYDAATSPKLDCE